MMGCRPLPSTLGQGTGGGGEPDGVPAHLGMVLRVVAGIQASRMGQRLKPSHRPGARDLKRLRFRPVSLGKPLFPLLWT
jgi:hypothetical protein